MNLQREREEKKILVFDSRFSVSVSISNLIKLVEPSCCIIYNYFIKRGICSRLSAAALCAQLSHKLNQIWPRVTLFAAAVAAANRGQINGKWQSLGGGRTKLSADFGYDCRLINAIRNNKQARCS